jgi:chorismate lyase/3-hydroxybenzoate synthase
MLRSVFISPPWRRVGGAASTSEAPEGNCLGELDWSAGSGPGPGRPPAALLAPAMAQAARDGLWAAGPLREGRRGGVHWRAAGGLCFGALDQVCGGRPLADLARAAYADVFASLRDAGVPRLLRVWNYLPAIHDDDAAALDAPSEASERYRQFNIGRQAAFIAEGHDAFAGSPAACALGVDGDVLSLRFIAGAVPTEAVDNPRQVPAWRYPGQYGPKAPTFSRASLVDFEPDRSTLMVSGTASIVGHGSCHPGDVRAQTRETLANLDAVLAQAARQRPALAGRHARELEATVYVRHARDLAAVQDELATAWGEPAARRAVYLRADVCRRELLVEIEGHLDPMPVPATAAGVAA